MNQLWVHLITDINDSRKDKMKQIESAISRWKDRHLMVEDRKHDALQNRNQEAYVDMENRQIEIANTIKSLTTQRGYVRFALKSSNEKFWVYKSGSCLKGNVPNLDEDPKIEHDQIPQEAEILRNISFHPVTKTVNLPLSIKMLIEMVEGHDAPRRHAPRQLAPGQYATRQYAPGIICHQ